MKKNTLICVAAAIDVERARHEATRACIRPRYKGPNRDHGDARGGASQGFEVWVFTSNSGCIHMQMLARC